jgi:hypothetical protein
MVGPSKASGSEHSWHSNRRGHAGEHHVSSTSTSHALNFVKAMLAILICVSLFFVALRLLPKRVGNSMARPLAVHIPNAHCTMSLEAHSFRDAALRSTCPLAYEQLG